ncbi:hypothetical protein HPB49_008967 [Dermacentor silvarum]|uniref:Uncharacterized protein n=1 Tax=Dermacentor silvarum TaxID=543639 RepID=A0ACB8DYY0_DERSI|nr:hypothetical protein HPB49_008967 [Dermacentor silvarum]
MAFEGIAPRDRSFRHRVAPCSHGRDGTTYLIEVYLLASGASKIPPGRCKALLLHFLGPRGQQLFKTLSVLQAAEKTEEEKETAATLDIVPSLEFAATRKFSPLLQMWLQPAPRLMAKLPS